MVGFSDFDTLGGFLMFGVDVRRNFGGVWYFGGFSLTEVVCWNFAGVGI